jgi:hypothetical protein
MCNVDEVFKKDTRRICKEFPPGAATISRYRQIGTPSGLAVFSKSGVPRPWPDALYCDVDTARAYILVTKRIFQPFDLLESLL